MSLARMPQKPSSNPVDLKGIEIFANAQQGDRVLTPEAVAFVAGLHRRFESRRQELLARRKTLQERLDGGALPDFLPETREIRESSWNIRGTPPDLRDRRVEITGPVDRKMIINALNSGANVFMADFEDSHSPTWEATIDGQSNLMDAVRKTIRFESGKGKVYELATPPSKTAVLVVRPRGWHLPEAHLRVDGQPVSASLFDFGLYFYHNAHELLRHGSGPYFYLPKMESHLEARLWNDVFVHAQKEIGLQPGTIKATVLIETILACFEMDEILYELRDHIVGLNCGRWDYIFSYIKKFRLRDFALLPDRALVTMNSPFLKAYSELLIHTAHRRGAHAMGGMAAQIPIRQVSEEDVKSHQAAMRQVWNDKDREVTLGHDGTWVAHPGLVELARQAYDAKMKTPNQLQMLRGQFHIEAAQLLEAPHGHITEAGVKKNLRVALIYLEAWLGGLGCVPIDHLMEDAATAEIARAQVWQWLRHPKAQLEGHRKLTETDVRAWMDLEQERAIKEARLVRGDAPLRFDRARIILEDLIYDNQFADFLTLAAYPEII
jgi:malate synthase